MWGLVGKGTITGEVGQALYNVDLDYGSTIVNARIDVRETRIAEIDVEIAALEGELSQAAIAETIAQNALDAAIVSNKLSPSEDNVEAINSKTVEWIEAGAKPRALRKKINYLKIEKSNLQSKIDQLREEVIAENRQVWCVDYTLEATGEVATIEINGEGPESGILIGPKAEGYIGSEDGRLLDRMAVSAETAYLNAAILPGWQKWFPTYRTGILDSIDRGNNTGIVTLDDTPSSAQGLPINITGRLVDVPFDYLECDNAAFEFGDHVVVQLVGQDWSNPKIIGFVSNPRPCGPERIWFPVGFDGSTVLDTYNDTFNIGLWTRSTAVDGVTTQEWRSGDFNDGPPGPGFNWFGDARPSGGSNTATIRIIYGGGGVLASINGDGPSATWRTDYTCASGDAVLSSQQIAAWTEIGSGLAATDIRAINTLSYIPQPDGEWNRDYVTMNPSSPPTFYDDRELDATGLAAIAAKNAYMATYFGNPPSPITLTAEGGGGVIYEFMRWGIIGEQSKPFNSEFPAVQAFGGLAAIYRLRRT
jgi:hypothetical protein